MNAAAAHRFRPSPLFLGVLLLGQACSTPPKDGVGELTGPGTEPEPHPSGQSGAAALPSSSGGAGGASGAGVSGGAGDSGGSGDTPGGSSGSTMGEPSVSASMDPPSNPPVQPCAAGESYCNGACLALSGDEAAGCRLVLSGGERILSILPEGTQLLLGHEREIRRLDLETLEAGTFVELPAGLSGAYELTALGEQVYFASQDAALGSTIHGVPRGGGEVAFVTNVDGLGSVQGLRAHGSLLYFWAGRLGGHAFSVNPIDGTLVEVTPDLIERFEVFGDQIYYEQTAPAQLVVAPLADVTAATVLHEGGYHIGLVPAESGIYWFPDIPSSEYWWMPSSGGLAEVVQEFDPPASLIARSDGTLLIGRGGRDGAIEYLTMPIDGGEPSPASTLVTAESVRYSLLTPTHVFHLIGDATILQVARP